MKDVITIYTNSLLMKRKPYLVRIKPLWCKFPVIGLPWQILPFHTGNVARQTRSLAGTHMQLLEFDAHDEMKMEFTVGSPSGFLFFLLRGEVRFYGQTGVQVSHAVDNTYYLVYNSAGRFTVGMDRGKHSFLVIALDSDWFIPSIENAHPAFRPLLGLWSAKAPHPILLPQKEIIAKVWRILARIRMAVVKNIDDGLQVLKYISECMNIYHGQLIEHERSTEQADLDRGKILKEYLSANYMFAEECRTERILEKLGWSNWTLRKVTEKVLGCTISHYIKQLRMDKASELLLTTNMTLRDIAISIGFSSNESFTKALKKFMKISPSDYRQKNR